MEFPPECRSSAGCGPLARYSSPPNSVGQPSALLGDGGGRRPRPRGPGRSSGLAALPQSRDFTHHTGRELGQWPVARFPAFSARGPAKLRAAPAVVLSADTQRRGAGTPCRDATARASRAGGDCSSDGEACMPPTHTQSLLHSPVPHRLANEPTGWRGPPRTGRARVPAASRLGGAAPAGNTAVRIQSRLHAPPFPGRSRTTPPRRRTSCWG